MACANKILSSIDELLSFIHSVSAVGYKAGIIIKAAVTPIKQAPSVTESPNASNDKTDEDEKQKEVELLSAVSYKAAVTPIQVPSVTESPNASNDKTDKYVLVISYFDRVMLGERLAISILEIIIAFLTEILIIDADLKLGVLDKPMLTIQINEKVTLSARSWTKDNSNNGIIQIFGDTVINNGIIDASACGFYDDNGPGYGRCSARDDDYCGGGGYGGWGGTGKMIRYYGGHGGAAYGNAELTKVYFGCGCEDNNHRGGGIIIIHCAEFINSGKLKCNGAENASGGSILIVTKKFQSTHFWSFSQHNADIQAIGGKKTESYGYRYRRNLTTCTGRGSCGRIAIYYDEIDGEINANPGPYTGTYKDGFEIIKHIIDNATEYINCCGKI